MSDVFQIKISDNLCSYFVKRPFGNLLLFADKLKETDSRSYELFSSVGGIFKVILESTQEINDFHGNLFTRYGASALCNMQKEYFDQRIKVERLADFSDPNINFLFNSGRNVIIINQKNKNIMFVGKEIKLNKDKSAEFQSLDITHYLNDLQQKHEVDLIYFTSFVSESVLTFKKENMFTSFLNKIS